MNNIPNFDDMNEDELMKFWAKYKCPTSDDAQDLIGARSDSIEVCSTLASYAHDKSIAKKFHREGCRMDAVVVEKCCDISYSRLPEDLKW